MPRLTKEYLQQQCAAAYQRGYAEGTRAAASAPDTVASRTRALVTLINSVGQAMDAQTRLLHGLSQTLDNSGAVR